MAVAPITGITGPDGAYLAEQPLLERGYAARGPASGGQRDGHDVEGMIFDEASPSAGPRELGSRGVARWDRRATEHAPADDRSRAGLPHVDKEGGTLVPPDPEAAK